MGTEGDISSTAQTEQEHGWALELRGSRVWFITIFDSLTKGLSDVVAWTAEAVLGDPVGLSQSCVTWGDAI